MDVAIFDSHKFEKEYFIKANRDELTLKFFETRLSERTTPLAAGCKAVCIFVNDDASGPVLRQLNDLGVSFIALRSAGFNNIDIEEAERLGIRVARVPEYSPYAVAEHTVALMLGLNRKIPKARNRVFDGNFSLDGLVGFDMNGKVAGIIGLGKIGRVVAKILHGFGCQVLGYDPHPNHAALDSLEVELVSLEKLCRISQIITLHLPLTPDTHYLVNADRIKSMRDGVMLINTSRGGLVDTRAVIDGLKNGKIGYLGLDVYEEESALFFEDHSDEIIQDDVIARLLTFPNVLVTSHQAFLTDTALENIAHTTIQNLFAWKRGLSAPHELWGNQTSSL